MLVVISGSRTVWGLQPGPCIVTQKKALSVDNYSRIHLNFDKIIQNKFTNTLSDKTPGNIHGKTEQISGLFGNAMQTVSNGSVVVSCKEFAPELHGFLTELWIRPGENQDDVILLELVDPEKSTLWQLRLSSAEQQSKLVWSANEDYLDAIKILYPHINGVLVQCLRPAEQNDTPIIQHNGQTYVKTCIDQTPIQDWPAIISKLKLFNYDGWITVIENSWPVDQQKDIAIRTAKYLQKLW